MLQRLARRTGRTKSEIIRDAIRQLAKGEGATRRARTAYESMKHAIGSFDSGGARLSERTGEKFRALLVARRQSRPAPRRRPGSADAP